MLFYIGNAFISNTRLKLAKKVAKTKLHPKDELLAKMSQKTNVSALMWLHD